MSNESDLFKELVAFAKEHDLEEIVWDEKGSRIAFRRDSRATPRTPAGTPGSVTAPEEPPAKPDIAVTSPMVGTFWRTDGKDRPPLVVEGELVAPGDKLAIIEAMKIPTDVVAFAGGHIKKILVENGQPVEYGQPLFMLEPLEGPAADSEDDN
jgi:biotin carboxyl carrier protein